MMNFNFFQLTLFAVLASALIACGGGKSDVNVDNAKQLVSGIYQKTIESKSVTGDCALVYPELPIDKYYISLVHDEEANNIQLYTSDGLILSGQMDDSNQIDVIIENQSLINENYPVLVDYGYTGVYDPETESVSGTLIIAATIDRGNGVVANCAVEETSKASKIYDGSELVNSSGIFAMELVYILLDVPGIQPMTSQNLTQIKFTDNDVSLFTPRLSQEVVDSSFDPESGAFSITTKELKSITATGEDANEYLKFTGLVVRAVDDSSGPNVVYHIKQWKEYLDSAVDDRVARAVYEAASYAYGKSVVSTIESGSDLSGQYFVELNNPVLAYQSSLDNVSMLVFPVINGEAQNVAVCETAFADGYMAINTRNLDFRAEEFSDGSYGKIRCNMSEEPISGGVYLVKIIDTLGTPLDSVDDVEIYSDLFTSG